MKTIKTKTIAFLLALSLMPNLLIAATSTNRFSGRIYLQVESHGEAWYVNPVNIQRYYLGRPADMFVVMRKLGLGITNANLRKIPTTTNAVNVDQVLVDRLRGRILLQVESKGEAWYVSPDDGRRYFLGSPSEAFALVRSFGQGILDKTLFTIKQADGFGVVNSVTPAPSTPVSYGDSHYSLSELEKLIFEGVNAERAKNGLAAVKWNDDVALAARQHSQSLWRENQAFTGIGRACDFPVIHHEGLDTGFMSNDRLEHNGTYYFQKNGENIALITATRIKVSFKSGDPAENDLAQCSVLRDQYDIPFKVKMEEDISRAEKEAIIKSEIAKRTAKFLSMSVVEVETIDWVNKEEIVNETVQGWMNSPGHRANILTADFDEAGMGVVIANGYVISTQVFIKRASCGYKGGACCVKTGYYPYCYSPYGCNNNICG